MRSNHNNFSAFQKTCTCSSPPRKFPQVSMKGSGFLGVRMITRFARPLKTLRRKDLQCRLHTAHHKSGAPRGIFPREPTWHMHDHVIKCHQIFPSTSNFQCRCNNSKATRAQPFTLLNILTALRSSVQPGPKVYLSACKVLGDLSLVLRYHCLPPLFFHLTKPKVI